MGSYKNYILIYSLFIVSFVFTTIFIFRGIFTPLGEQSFGRIWHYFLDWSDFGFSKRALFGTFIEVTQLTTFIKDPYFLAYFVYLILLISVFILLAKVILQSGIADQGTLVLFGIIFSPGLMMHFGYTTGNLDILLFLLLMILLFYISNTFLILLCVLISLLVHEMFIIFVPFFVFFRYLSLQQLSTKNLAAFFKPIIVLIFSVIACFAIMIFGSLEVPQIEFESLMQHQLGRASNQHSLWSGFYEVSSSVDSNIYIAHELLRRDFNDLSFLGMFLALIPFFYLVCLMVIFYVRADLSFYKRILAILLMLLPLILTLLANDLYRWVGFSIKLCFIAIIFLASKNKISLKKSDGFLLSILVLSGPYGDSSPLRPMPAIQFIFDNLF